MEAEVRNGKVRKVTFRNVPAFATHLDTPLEVRGLGTVTVDVAYGGMFYVIADAAPLGFRLTPGRGARHRAGGGDDQGGGPGAVAGESSGESRDRRHEHRADLGRAVAARCAPQECRGRVDRRVRLVAAFVVDRRSGPLAVRHGHMRQDGRAARQGKAAAGQDFVHEGILGTTFTGRLIEETRVGPYAAVVPTLSGQAWITGFAQYVVDPEDPFPEGFTVGDIWGR